MMSAQAIEALSREAAVLAAAYEIEPYIPEPDEPLRWGNRVALPNLGDYVPAGWKHVKEYCVGDWGMPGSMTSDEFKRELTDALALALIEDKTLGVAITATGEWCGWISIFEQDDSAEGNADDFPFSYCPNEDCNEPLEVDDEGNFTDDYCSACNEDLRPAPFKVGDQVDVGEPDQYDLWSHPFTGRVEAVDKDSEEITVVDQNDDAWEVDWSAAKLTYQPALDPAQLDLGL